MQTDDTKSILRRVLTLVVPQALVLLCHFLIGLTDVWVAGRLGAETQASLGLITQIHMVLLTISMASSNGVVAAISQSFGAGKIQRARRYITLVCVLIFCIALVLALLGRLFQEDLLIFVETPEAIMPIATKFLQISLLTLPAQYLVSIIMAIFRTTQSLFVPFYVIFCVMLFNVFASLGLGLGYFGLPKFGAQGIAWATFLSVSLGALCLLGLLVKRELFVIKELPNLRWARIALSYIIVVATPAFFTALLWNAGYFILFIITASLPVENLSALAGLTVGIRIETFFMAPALACNMTAAVLVGHLLGANRKDDAKKYTLVLWGCAVSFMLLFSLILWPFREEVASWISIDEAVQKQAILYLRYNLLAIPFSVTSIILAGAFNGAGASKYSLLVFASTTWLVRLPLAYIFGHFIWKNAQGVYFSMLISQIVQALLALNVFFRYPWTEHTLRAHNMSKLQLKNTV